MYKDGCQIGLRDSVTNEVKRITDTCKGCGLCRSECAFLSEYGNPGDIAAGYPAAPDRWQAIAFECSLCGMCTAVCPLGLDPSAMFLEFRREAVQKGADCLPEHRRLLNYEKRGTAKRYTYYAFPENCSTVFFPGCALAGTRPHTTLKTYAFLNEQLGAVGIVLDCCTKPSHDLGRQKYFENMFGEMAAYLAGHGIKTVITACPGCHKIFKTYGECFRVQTVYEIMAGKDFEGKQRFDRQITLHDPCPFRFEKTVQASVRRLVKKSGLEIADTPHQGEKTYCCGEGGAVACVNRKFAAAWTEKRIKENRSRKIVSYCAGCVNLLAKKSAALHVLDLIFYPERSLTGKTKGAKAPFTYLNRLRLKKKLKTLPAVVTRERTPPPVTEKRKPVPKFILLLAVILLIAGLRLAGIDRLLDPETLQIFVQNSGKLAPAVYMLIYTLAPSLFLPGIPIAIAGGILFGPVWGVVYTIFSSTAGAGLAFMISRYISSGFIESRMSGPGWNRLQHLVQKHGWKAVALTRLVPLFPFNLLNYAFGLTPIKFSHYIVTTFFFMLPGCIAFIVFSSSIPQLIQGNISFEFFLGCLLIAIVSLIPVLYKNIRKPADKPHHIDK